MEAPKINYPKCKDDDFVQFDEGIVDGLYCKHCDVLVDEDGNIIQEVNKMAGIQSDNEHCSKCGGELAFCDEDITLWYVCKVCGAIYPVDEMEG